MKGKLRKEFIERVGTDLNGDFIVKFEVEDLTLSNKKSPTS